MKQLAPTLRHLPPNICEFHILDTSYPTKLGQNVAKTWNLQMSVHLVANGNFARNVQRSMKSISQLCLIPSSISPPILALCLANKIDLVKLYSYLSVALTLGWNRVEGNINWCCSDQMITHDPWLILSQMPCLIFHNWNIHSWGGEFDTLTFKKICLAIHLLKMCPKSEIPIEICILHWMCEHSIELPLPTLHRKWNGKQKLRCQSLSH